LGRCKNERLIFFEACLENTSKLDSLVLGACERAGVSLVEMELSGTRRKILRLFISKNGGVSVEDCARTSRYLSEELDKEENEKLIDTAYTLEVSSPGIDKSGDFNSDGKTLKKGKQWQREQQKKLAK